MAPGKGYFWIGGYHRWTGTAYVWVPGRWALPPRPGAVWLPGHWKSTPTAGSGRTGTGTDPGRDRAHQVTSPSRTCFSKNFSTSSGVASP